jgi:hypothetical protein
MTREAQMLADERNELYARLSPGVLDWMPLIERAAERRALRQRIDEITMMLGEVVR